MTRTAYDDGHIPGAVLWNVYQDLKDSEYRLVDRSAIEALLSRSGVTSNSTVVFYGYAPALAFWLLRWYRHADAKHLSLARARRHRPRRPGRGAAGHRGPGHDDRRRPHRGRVPRRAVLAVRWHGAGRPGRSHPVRDPPEPGRPLRRGRPFCSPAELADVFASVDPAPGGQAITYCAIGGRACTAWFALTYLLGREGIRVYAGSWAEWGRTPLVPVEQSTAA